MRNLVTRSAGLTRPRARARRRREALQRSAEARVFQRRQEAQRMTHAPDRRSQQHFAVHAAAALFAEELAVPYEFVPIYDMTALGPEVYAGNPALKLPDPSAERLVLFGALEYLSCHRRTGRAACADRMAGRNALRYFARRAGTRLARDGCAGADSCSARSSASCPRIISYFTKARAGLEGSLEWLDQHM